MTMDNEFHIAYVTDDGYLSPTQVSVCSALKHSANQAAMVIDILDCGISSSRWSDFERCIGVRFPRARICRHLIDMGVFQKCAPYGGSRATYARILPPILLHDVKWCLFSDGDVLFVDDPLKLIDYYDDDKIVIGNVDYVKELPNDSWEREKLRWFESNGMNFNPDQFVCMGFALMNLSKMRAVGFVEKCMEGFMRFSPSASADQETINVVSQGLIGILPYRWGAYNLALYSNPSEVPSAIHFVFGKPWLLNARWTRGLSDADLLWLSYARNVAGLSVLPTYFSVTFIRRFLYRQMIRLLIVFDRRLWRLKMSDLTRVVYTGLFASKKVRSVMKFRGCPK